VAYLRWCQSLYPAKKVLVLWDGASYHRGQEMQSFLAQENGGLAEADWKITCMRFAPKAPEQNPVEDLWLKGKTYLRQLCRQENLRCGQTLLLHFSAYAQF
jgi:transposase